jgi:hypothetical protein
MSELSVETENNDLCLIDQLCQELRFSSQAKLSDVASSFFFSLPNFLLIYQATEKRNFNKSRAEACMHSKGQLSQIYILCHKDFLKSIFCVTREIEI